MSQPPAVPIEGSDPHARTPLVSSPPGGCHEAVRDVSESLAPHEVQLCQPRGGSPSPEFLFRHNPSHPALRALVDLPTLNTPEAGADHTPGKHTAPSADQSLALFPSADGSLSSATVLHGRSERKKNAYDGPEEVVPEKDRTTPAFTPPLSPTHSVTSTATSLMDPPPPPLSESALDQKVNELLRKGEWFVEILDHGCVYFWCMETRETCWSMHEFLGASSIVGRLPHQDAATSPHPLPQPSSPHERTERIPSQQGSHKKVNKEGKETAVHLKETPPSHAASRQSQSRIQSVAAHPEARKKQQKSLETDGAVGRLESGSGSRSSRSQSACLRGRNAGIPSVLPTTDRRPFRGRQGSSTPSSGTATTVCRTWSQPGKSTTEKGPYPKGREERVGYLTPPCKDEGSETGRGKQFKNPFRSLRDRSNQRLGLKPTLETVALPPHVVEPLISSPTECGRDAPGSERCLDTNTASQPKPPSIPSPVPEQAVRNDVDTSFPSAASSEGGDLPWRDRIVALYQQYNPDKLPSVDALLRKYKGHETELYTAIRIKYESDRTAQIHQGNRKCSLRRSGATRSPSSYVSCEGNMGSQRQVEANVSERPMQTIKKRPPSVPSRAKPVEDAAAGDIFDLCASPTRARETSLRGSTVRIASRSPSIRAGQGRMLCDMQTQAERKALAFLAQHGVYLD